MKVYLDNVIVCGRVRSDLHAAEMEAVRAIEAAEKDGRLELVTSRESWREQDRTKDDAVRSELQLDRPNVPVVAGDHCLLGFHHQQDLLGGFIAYPLVSDIVDEALFNAFKAAGLREADARHLMYAVTNGCHMFVTTDLHFLDRKHQLELLCRGLLIVRPSDLVAELNSGSVLPGAMDPPTATAFADRHSDRPERTTGDGASKIGNSVRRKRGRAIGL